MKRARKPVGTWLRAKAAGAVAGVSRWTISRWIANGIIPDAALLRCGSRQHRVARWWLEQSAPRAA